MNRSNPFTAVKESVSHNWHKVRARSPRASNWEKLQALDPEQTPEYRDVHGDQQLDRRERTTVRSQTLSRAVSTVVVILVAVLLWIIASLGVMLVTNARAVFGSGGTSGYYVQESEVGDAGEMGDCYYPIDAEGEVDRTVCYDDADQVPVPGWYAEQQAASGTDEAGDGRTTFVAQLGVFTWWKLYLAGGVGAIVGLVLGGWWGRQIAKHNITVDHADINDHYDDPHIAQPEELQRQLAHFPDAGAHSSVQVTAMISHNMLTNKGLDKVALTRRHEHDVLDEDGNVINHAGEPIVDEDGEPVTDQVPWIDEEYGQDLFETSGVPQDKKLRTVYDPTRIAYGGDGGRFATVAALINTDWTLPEYEVQRPAGTYLVDSDPVNTMIIAMTRAGKGQTYIEPVIDMWSREANPNNMVINDPKGELLVKFYVALVMRGFKVVQFNLINPLKTDIYNPLMLAADAARENDSATAATYVENLGNVFFPTDTGDDPMWNNAANNAFKRAAFGLIDYYLEEEREMRVRARNDGTDPAVLDQQLDEMWGRLTLYNCYQLFVQLSGQRLKNPMVSHQEKLSRNEYATQGDADRAEAEANERAFLWEGAKELDMLTLFFNATAALPLNSMRTLVNNADKSLRSMGSAEKMIASVYGIAITAMSFFTKPTIATLTSGRPSQNIDLGGISFPRRLNVRLAPDFVRENHLVGMRTVWGAYADPGFTQNLGKKFDHSDLLSREGWARYYIEGIFPEETVYVKLELRNPVSDLLVRTLYFEFRKGYQLSLNGRHYVEESVTGKRIVRDGVLRELRPVTTTGDDGEERTRYLPGHVTYRRSIIDPGSVDTVPEVIEVDTPAIIHTIVRYGEQPSAVFLVTPPHLASYAKILLILIEQMVSLNFERSYMTKENQKPLHKTRFMLDELGNLQSEGKGIESFETKLSIGLGQDQQFTLILQTLQQLRNVYGDSVDKVLQGNTSHIIFLKSTDDSLLETLEKMGGKTHRVHITSKSITENMDKVAGGRLEGAVSRNYQVEEEPLISYNDLATLPQRNSIVYRAGEAPVWNRNSMILPMSWRLRKNDLHHPGHTYSLQTVPTLSTAIEFDVRHNQPDFKAMLDKRIEQAVNVERAQQQYKSVHGYNDVDIERLDPDVWSDEIMEIVTNMTSGGGADDIDAEDYMFLPDEDIAEDVELHEEVAMLMAQQNEFERKIYAEGTVSRDMLVTRDGNAKVRSLDARLIEAYTVSRISLESDHDHFSVGDDGSLRSADGRDVYVTPTHSAAYTHTVELLDGKIAAPTSNVWAEGEVDPEAVLPTFEVTAEFYRFLAAQPTWTNLGDGSFDRAMAIEMDRV